MAGAGALSKNVFLTGCSGAVGSRLTLLLLKSGFKVWGVRSSKPCKILDKNHLCRELNLLSSRTNLDLIEFKPDIMVHTAWITTPGVFWESLANDKWVEVSKKLIEEFSQSGGKYLVVTSTCAEYSWETTLPLSETSKTSPQSRYGRSKLELLTWVSQQEIPFLWARTFFQFGLREVYGRLIPSIIDEMLAGNQYLIRSSQDVRDFVYIQDVVEILAHLISKQTNGIVNIGTGEGISVEKVGRIIARLIGREDLLEFQSSSEINSIVVSDSRKLLSIIGNYPWTDFEKAIFETIDSRREIFQRK